MKMAILAADRVTKEGRKILVPEACQQYDLDTLRHHRLSLLIGGSTQKRFCIKSVSRARLSHPRRCTMEVIYPRCCGLDIHKKTVVACVILSDPGQPPRKETRTFRTMTADL